MSTPSIMDVCASAVRVSCAGGRVSSRLRSALSAIIGRARVDSDSVGVGGVGPSGRVRRRCSGPPCRRVSATAAKTAAVASEGHCRGAAAALRRQPFRACRGVAAIKDRSQMRRANCCRAAVCRRTSSLGRCQRAAVAFEEIGERRRARPSRGLWVRFGYGGLEAHRVERYRSREDRAARRAPRPLRRETDRPPYGHIGGRPAWNFTHALAGQPPMAPR